MKYGLTKISADIGLLFVVLSWASTHAAIKSMFEVMTPFGVTALRFIIMFLTAGAYLFWTKPTFDKKDWRVLLLIAMLSHGIYQIAYVGSVENAGAFIAGIMISLVPIFTLVIVITFRTEKLTKYQLIGTFLAAAFTCAFVLVTSGFQSTTLYGIVLGLSAAFMFAAYGVIVKPLARKYPLLPLISIQVFLGAPVLIALGAKDLTMQHWDQLTAVNWLIVLYLAWIPAYLSYGIWNWAISIVGAARASAYILLMPLLASTISLLTLHEKWSLASLICATGILIGLLITRISTKEEHQTTTQMGRGTST